MFNWLRKTGIKYNSVEKEHAFYGKDMVDSLNPFDAVVENKQYPLARIYRTSILTGISDTYDVIVGDHYDNELRGSGRKGLLDFLIFPLVGRWLMGISNNPNNNLALRIVTGIPAYLLEVPRFILGAALTIPAIPIVALVHAITAYKSYKLKQAAEKLPIKVKGGSSTTILSRFLRDRRSSIEQVKWLSKPSETTPLNAQANDHEYAVYTFQKSLSSALELYRPTFFTPIISSDTDETYVAFKKLNVGGRFMSR